MMNRSKKIRVSWLKQCQYEKLFQRDIHENNSIPHYYEHPNSIYQCPSDSLSYFLKKSSLKQCLFPRRAGYSKNFVWKKNNFTTKFPKNNPIVQYLIATTTDKQYKMITVKYLKKECGLIFCLIRKNSQAVNFKENAINNTPIKQIFEGFDADNKQKICEGRTCEKIFEIQNQQCYVSEVLKEIYPNQNCKFHITMEPSETIMPL